MARLTLIHEGAVLREYPLTKERTTIGRKPHNDIQLDDPTVSGQHAAVLLLQNVYIEDLDSTNGVILNGKKITRRQLQHGDIIRIGRHELKFMDEKVQDFESTVILTPEKPAAGDAQPAERYQIRILSGPKAGETIDLVKPYTTLGSPGLQVAVVARRGKDYYLMPMGGTTGDHSNPPRVNGEPLGAGSRKLEAGDTIEVAGSKLQFVAAE